jgi:hypothetical protein
MKNYFSFSLLTALLLSFSACDYVDQPLEYSPANSGAACPDVAFPTNPSPVRNILMEDYTGHECGNCPAAARVIADSITPAYGDRVVVMGVHAGYFADLGAAPYLEDFKTEAGDEYDTYYELSTQCGNPVGMINRRDYNNTSYSHGKLPSKWKAIIDTIIIYPPDIDIQIINEYDSLTHKVCIHVQSEFLNNLSGDYKLLVLMTQDSIIAPQKDYTVPSPSLVANYVHRHVLRGALNGKWGEDIATGGAAAGLKVYKKYQYEIPAMIRNIPVDVSKCHIVAFVYDNANDRVVIQSQEEKVIP